jgi:hypothetical protein
MDGMTTHRLLVRLLRSLRATQKNGANPESHEQRFGWPMPGLAS